MSVPDRPHPFPWKAAAPSLAVSGVLLAVTVCAASVLYVNHRATAAALDRTMDGFHAAVDLEVRVHELRTQLTDYVRTGDESKLSDLTQLQDAASGSLSRVEAIVISPDGHVRISAIRRSFSNLDQRLRDLSTAEKEIHRQQILQLVNDVLDDEILKRAAEQRNQTEQALQAVRSDNTSLTAWAGWVLVLLGLGGTAAGVFSGFAVARAWHRQIIDLSVSVHSAAGTLEPVMNDTRPVEIHPSGDLSHVQSMVDALSERVGQVVNRLQAAERESMRQDQLAALGQLAAGLAHELRNPLTSIKTLVQSARGSEPGCGLDDRDLEVIDAEITRLDATLQSFLDYARPPKLARRPVDLREIVTATVQLAAPRAERQRVAIVFDRPAEPLTLVVDPDQLKQVLLNLLLNAVDALTDGGEVRMRLAEDTESDTVRLTVEDDGPGISPALLPRLFEPFVSSKASGTGLGLTICRRIIDSHGGAISAANRTGGGARFTIVLPRRPETSAATTDPDYAHAADH